MGRTRQPARFKPKNATSGSYTLEELRQRGDLDRKHEPATRKKHKFAVLCGYLGLRYHGLQIQPNPAIATIEKELERAFFLAGGIQECNFGSFHKLNWSRAARTDKGVHAVGQIVSLNLQIQASETQQFVDRCNEFLPEDIRVFDCIRVTSGFNPKNLCGRRRYQYLLPTYALQPRDALETVLKEAYDAHDAAHGIPPREEETKEGAASTDEKNNRPRLTLEELASVVPTLCNWRVDEETLARLRAALNKYVGTHNYHNFTSRMKPTDKSAMRYMLSFECSDPMVDEVTGQEWVCLTVVGQSFLLNQIRKMVALAVEVARGGVPLDHMDVCFGQSKVLLPIAPGDNLHLDMLFYEPYNAKVLQMHNSAQPSKKQRTEHGATELSHANEGDDGSEQKVDEGAAAEVSLGHRPLDWDSDPVVSEKIASFKKAVIWRHIFDLEFQQRTSLLWLDSCRFLAYRFQIVPDDFGAERSADQGAAEGGDDANEEADEGGDAGVGPGGDDPEL